MITDTKTPTNARLLEVLDQLAADHPGSYFIGSNTDHKRETDLSYSYDDCLVGCVIHELDPELHADLLAWEKANNTSFTLVTFRAAVAPQVAKIRRLFTAAQFDVLATAQMRQDGRAEWKTIVEDPSLREALA